MLLKEELLGAEMSRFCLFGRFICIKLNILLHLRLICILIVEGRHQRSVHVGCVLEEL